MRISKPSTESLLVKIREMRDSLLKDTDFTQLPDSSLTDEQKQEWADYRQALRDFPTVCDPVNPTWPIKPDMHNRTKMRNNNAE